MNQRQGRRQWRRKTAWVQLQPTSPPTASAGFTLIEMLVVIVIVGILMGIMAPGWLQTRNVQTLNTAQDTVLQAMRQAQSQAISKRRSWQAGFRQVDDRVEWAVSTADALPPDPQWQPLPKGVQIVGAETTLNQTNGVYQLVFDHRGHVLPPLGRINLGGRQLDRNRRCIVVSTFLGVLRKAADQDCAQPE
ncbi:MAG: GspH/FimT family pseudopilin [Elainella sp.]